MILQQSIKAASYEGHELQWRKCSAESENQTDFTLAKVVLGHASHIPLSDSPLVFLTQ